MSLIICKASPWTLKAAGHPQGSSWDSGVRQGPGVSAPVSGPGGQYSCREEEFLQQPRCAMGRSPLQQGRRTALRG